MSVSLPVVARSTSKPNETAVVQTAQPVDARAAGSAIEQALTLRDTLRTAAQQAGELARSLKQQKRQSRIVASTLASLKELQRVAG